MKKGPSKDVYSEKTSHISKPHQNMRFITTETLQFKARQCRLA